MKYIAIKGLDRGGTNVFLSLFHCHPEFFSLSEKVHSLANKNDIKEIPTGKLAKYSMFRGLDKGLKDHTRVRNIVFKMPREAEFNDKVYRYRYHEFEYDRIIYLIRNPLRVFLSHRNYNRRHNITRDWDYWNSILNQTWEHLTESKSGKQNTRLVTYEYFIKKLGIELSKIFTWIDKDSQNIDINPQMNRKFWSHCGICQTRLVKDGKHVRCPKCAHRIQGHGKFNPIIPVIYKRTIQENLKAQLTDKQIKDVHRKFGKALSRYWLNDTEHNYVAPLETL